MKRLPIFTGNILLGTLVCIALLAPLAFAQAQGFVPLAGIPGFTQGALPKTLADYVNVLFRVAIGVGALIAVIKITIAGIKYMGNDSFFTKEEAKKDIRGALFGLIIILSTVVVLSLINTQLLNIDALQNLDPVHINYQAPANTNREPVSSTASTTVHQVAEQSGMRVAFTYETPTGADARTRIAKLETDCKAIHSDGRLQASRNSEGTHVLSCFVPQ